MVERKFIIYDSIERDWATFVERFIIQSNLIDFNSFSVNLFHNWFDNVRATRKSLSIRTNGFKQWYNMQISIGSRKSDKIDINGYGISKKHQMYDIISQIYHYNLHQKLKFQMMDGDLPDGKDLETSVKKTTTIIELAADEETVTSGANTILPTLDSICNGEIFFEMPNLTDRFEIFKSDIIKVGEDKSINVNIPQDILSNKSSKSANLALFRNFIYSKLELEIRIIVNAPKFGQGKIIASWFPDHADDIDSYFYDRCSLVQRPHVIIDLNVQNSATLIIPQAYRRTFIRNVKTDKAAGGLQYASMARLQITMLSKYATGTGQPTEIPLQIFYRFVRAKFAAVSYPVSYQMDKMIGLAGEVVPEIKIAENLLKRVGFIGNNDKPYSMSKTIVIPHSRRDFCSGSGISDSIPLTFNGNSTITTLDEYINDGDPKNIYDVVHKWGLLGDWIWKTSDVKETQLFEYEVTPCPRAINETDGSYSAMNIFPTPLDIISNCYAFYNGSIEYKFCFVSTPFHTGTVQIEISYGRLTSDIWDNAAVYTKTFQLGEDRDVEITVPYIYDTPWRRCSSIIQPPSNSFPGGEVKVGEFAWYLNGSQILQDVSPTHFATNFVNNTRIRMRVINPLTPLDNVSKEISILVFIRAGNDYQLQSVVPSMLVSIYPFGGKQWKYPPFLQQFPVYKTAVFEASEIEADDEFDYNPINYDASSVSKIERVTRDFKVNIGDYNKKRFGKDRTIHYQGDFSTGPNLRYFHSTDEQSEFKTLMRRNYFLKSIWIKEMGQSNVDVMKFSDHGDPHAIASGYSVYMLPVILPTHLNMASNLTGPLASPLCVLASLFRHWRGSLRYTFVCNSITNTPIYVSYIPNLGTQFLGNKFIPKTINKFGDTQLDHDVTLLLHPAALGFATEILLPSVNPSISVTTPFDCMFNRCVNCVRVRGADHSNVKTCALRDDATGNAGHLMIYSARSVTLDVFLSVGDDFEMQNFIGCTRYRQNITRAISDDKTRDSSGNFLFNQDSVNTNSGDDPCTVIDHILNICEERKKQIHFQMFSGARNKIKKTINGIDEGSKNFSDKVDRISDDINNFLGCTSASVDTGLREIKNVAENANSSMVALTNSVGNVVDKLDRNLDVVTAAVMESNGEIKRVTESSVEMTNEVKSTMIDVRENTGKITRNFTKNFDKLTETMNKVGEGVGENMDKIMSTIKPFIDRLSGFCDQFASMKDNILSYTIDVIFDVVILVRNFDLLSFVLVFLKYVAKILLIKFDVISHWSEKMLEKIKCMIGFELKEQMSDSNADRTSSGLFGLFVSMISSVFRFTCADPKPKYSYGSKWMEYIFDPKSVQYTNSIMTLFERTFKIFMGAIKWCMKYSTETRESALDKMSQYSAEISEFMLDVAEVTNPANRKILNRSDIVRRAWKSYMFATAVRKKLVLTPGNSAASILLQEANKIIRFCDENWARMSCCPVRLEPLVVCFTGESDAGKSHMSVSLAVDMMTSVGYKHEGSNPTFTRAPGRKHWDGYYDQPVILFDDWMNLSDPTQSTEQIADLYELKSTCDFIPAKADISEKGAKANPWLVILLTNDAFPNNITANVCNHKEAVYRRRDRLYCTRRTKEYRGTRLHGMDWDKGQNYPHLEFKLIPSVLPVDRTLASYMNDDSGWCDYATMKGELIVYYQQYMSEERVMASHRLRQFCRDLPENIQMCVNPMDIYNFRREEVETNNEFIANIPSRKLDEDIRSMMVELNPLIKEQIGFSPSKKKRKQKKSYQLLNIGITMRKGERKNLLGDMIILQ